MDDRVAAQSAPQDADLTDCDREPIHILGHVQGFGCLIAVSHDWVVSHASQNVATFLGVTAEELIGTALVKVLLPDAIHDIRSKLQILAGADAVERIFRLDVIADGSPMDVAIHLSGRTIILEFERSEAGRAGDRTGLVRPMIDRLRAATSTDALLDLSVRHMRALTGFDRVMMYRFAPDGTGEVVAESRRLDMEPFLGLRYPASDIPAQARALYTRSLLRIIADVDGERSAILPPHGPDGAPLDLSLSSLRAVSPIHLEYLRNMGVQASMSVSVMRRGKLWGLIACHHNTARTLGYETRSAAEMFGQILSFVLDQKLTDAEQAAAESARAVHDRLMASMVEGHSIGENFTMLTDAIRDVIPWDGAVAWVGGKFESRGLAPDAAGFDRLQQFFTTAQSGSVYAVSDLGRLFPNSEALGGEIAGVLAIPVSRSPRDYIVLFRREVVQTVRWAGEPSKAAETGGRLSPRKSFAAWQQVVRGTSQPWTAAEIQVADSLRITLIEIVLRLTDRANEDRDRARARQELLIAELNHRVRNMLNLIRGLIVQSASGTASVAEFTEMLGGRVHALARAHDQLTREQWQPASLRDLLYAEIDGFLGARDTRVTVTGPDPMLRPLAFSTLALVMHELLTNSVKYGALSAAEGRVTFDMSEHEDGIAIRWRERCGPTVRPPTRHGFGTAIIERSIPHELGGQARVSYAPDGLEATFHVPHSQIAGTRLGAGRSVEQTRLAQTDSDLDIPSMFVLEDNMIIGMDAEGILQDLGVRKVHLFGNNAAALEFLETGTVTAALLDVNLGLETSAPVAQRLRDLGIPFLFATGYGEVGEQNGSDETMPVIQKPFSNDSIRTGLRKLLG